MFHYFPLNPMSQLNLMFLMNHEFLMSQMFHYFPLNPMSQLNQMSQLNPMFHYYR
jgi:hypothetical protein